MENSQIRQDLQCLIQGMLSLKILIEKMETPIRVVQGNEDAATLGQNSVLSKVEVTAINSLLHKVATALHMPEVTLISPLKRLSVFEQAVSRYVGLERYRKTALELSTETRGTISALVADAHDRVTERLIPSTYTTAADGALLKVYSLGRPVDRGVVLVLPCGLPAAICKKWMDVLGREYFVVTWETRGMFSPNQQFEGYSSDVSAQVQDMFEVMNQFGVQTAHVMGFCGGAVIALMSACAQPNRVSSLSLWHGDYELGPDCPKTSHQEDIKALMSMAAADRSSAASLQALVAHSEFPAVPLQFAPLVLYPYANPELLFRYAHLNGSIMNTNIETILGSIVQPTLVVTSNDDVTAHPLGSKHVAAAIKGACLHIFEHGDHLTLFNAEEATTDTAIDFINKFT